jgi:hypothetical protein
MGSIPRRSIRFSLATVVALGLSLALNACVAGSPSSSGTTSTPQETSRRPSASSHPGGAEVNTSAGAQDKCRIVPAVDVTSAMGGRLVAETAGTSGVGNPVCTLQFAKTPFGADVGISLSTNQSGTRAQFSQTRTQLPGTISLTALGDDAFYSKSTRTVEVRSGAKVIIVQAAVHQVSSETVSETKLQAALIRVARTILAQ